MQAFTRRALTGGLVPLTASLVLASPQLPIGTQDEVTAVPPPQEGTADPNFVEPDVQAGEQVSIESINVLGVEGWDAVFERQANLEDPQAGRRQRRGEQGTWVVPSVERSELAHSGSHLVCNKWGDTSMGIRFGGLVDLSGAWFAGMGAEGSWSPAVRAIGYRDGDVTRATEWFQDVDDSTSFFAMNLTGIDRVVIESRVAVNGAGYYSLDDLTFTSSDGVETIVDFEDVKFDTTLSGQSYAGLTWEVGTGDFSAPLGRSVAMGNLEVVAPPVVSNLGGAGTAPTIVQDFPGPRFGNAGAFSIPPDTVGAVGTNHFVASVNSNLSVYDKATAARLVNVSLAAFLNSPGVGDPRVVFDPDSERWFILATDFSNRIYFAVSTTDDPTGTFFRFNFLTTGGIDGGTFPDFPTLGVDARGVYTAIFAIGGAPRMTLFTIDKAPLIAANPSMGTLTAFRSLTFEGAIQPAVHFDDPGFAHLISTNATNRLRLRRLMPPLTAPTLVAGGFVTVGTHPGPPDAPAMGSTTPLDSGDDRLHNAVFRNGSIWTSHTVGFQGRASARWYEIDPNNLSSSVQQGTISDPVISFFHPAIAVNSVGDAVIGMSASSPSMFGSAWVTGRAASDPLGETGVPFEYRAGVGAYNNLDGFGRNRWGDYSLTSADPVDDTLWTIQERSRMGNTWATHIAQLAFEEPSTVNFCVSNPNSFSLGGGSISSTGSASLASNDLTLTAESVAANQFGLFFQGVSQVQTPLGNGFLCAGGNIFRFPVIQTTGGGTASFLIDNQNLPAGTPSYVAGQTANFQFWFRDPVGAGFNFTDGLAVTFQP